MTQPSRPSPSAAPRLGPLTQDEIRRVILARLAGEKRVGGEGVTQEGLTRAVDWVAGLRVDGALADLIIGGKLLLIESDDPDGFGLIAPDPESER